MAGKDLLALCNGIRHVLTTGCSTLGADIRHCIVNSSLQPVLGGLCDRCSELCGRASPPEQDLNIPDVPGISDAGLGDWVDHKVSSDPVPKYSNMKGNNNNVRKYHTSSDSADSINSSIKIDKDIHRPNQKVDYTFVLHGNINSRLPW